MLLKDLREVFPQMINVTEAFDTRFPSVTWKESNGMYYAQEMLKGEQFEMLIEPAQFEVNGEQIVWLNIAFAREIDGEMTTDLIGKNENTSAIFGAISNALKDKIKELDSNFEIQAIGLGVRAGEEKRIPIYKRFVSSMVYGLNEWSYAFQVKMNIATMIIATRKKLTPDEVAALKREVEKHGKALI